MVIQIDNKTARNLFLEKHALCINPAAKSTKSNILQTVKKLGFVQVDSIKTVERAHHLILFSRHQTFCHQMLEELLGSDRTLFENWTHDAAIIPTRFYPYWKHRFSREKREIVARWEKWGRQGFQQISNDVVTHIRRHGPTFSRDLKPPDNSSKPKTGWWDWHPSKTALEYLWRTGRTAICHRHGFQKAYDISANVIPQHHLKPTVSAAQFRDWACASALERLGFATHGEIAAFWALIKPGTVKKWIEQQGDKLVQVEISSFDKKSSKFYWAFPETLKSLHKLPPAPARLRILSPFDPLLRDRKRAEFLFGFNYRIEVFVPHAKRKYGYYVFPMLEGSRIMGRIDMKADRKCGQLNVRRIWLEDGIKWSQSRRTALNSELARLAKFSELHTIKYDANAFAN